MRFADPLLWSSGAQPIGSKRDIATMNFSRIIESLLNPIGLLWAGLLIHAGWSLRKRRWGSMIFAVSSAFVLWLVGATTVPARLLATLERPYGGVDWSQLPAADGIVLLGGTLTVSTNDIYGYQLSDSSDRLLTSLELLRRGKGRFLVVGGGGLDNSGATGESGFLRRVQAALNLTNQLIFLRPSLNTHDEAVQVRALAREQHWQRLHLVTSAAHMRRAMALFRHLEIPVSPAACDFLGMSNLDSDDSWNPVPRLGGFMMLSSYLHEQIGWYYYRQRGWIGSGGE